MDDLLRCRIVGLEELKSKLSDMGRKQVPFAASRAINTMAKRVEQKAYDELKSVLDRPTAYTMRALAVKRSTKADLTAVVGIKGSAPGLGYDAPGKGTPWERALGHHFDGGARHWKKFEAALMKIGVLPAGMSAVVPSKASWAAPIDAHGNLPPSVIRLLLSYFNAAEMTGGYVANMSDRRRSKLHNIGRNANSYKIINGVMYFAIPRRVNGSPFHPGIWAKRGTHGSDVAPVLLFVRRASYQKRIDLQRIADGVVSTGFQSEFDKEFAKALRTAR
jgi:hypothetical protein